MQHPQLFFCSPEAHIPNSPLPVLFYSDAQQGSPEALEKVFRHAFSQNGWYNFWVAGIFTYTHYHSITHEVMGVCEGRAWLLLGGENGIELEVKAGDVLIIPAGVAHCNLDKENDIVCLGAYPDGRSYDMMYGRPGEMPGAKQRANAVPLPAADPFSGTYGLPEIWPRYSSGHK